jgi:hypothetical protein
MDNPDCDDEYLPQRDLVRLLGILATTIARWADDGRIAFVERDGERWFRRSVVMQLGLVPSPESEAEDVPDTAVPESKPDSGKPCQE